MNSNRSLTSETERTSAISAIAYDVEIILANDELETLLEDLEELQVNGQFPQNLQFIDAFYDEETSVSGVAFRDIDTGEVILGYAGTNSGTSDEGYRKDLETNYLTAITGHGPTSNRKTAIDSFITHLEEVHDIEQIDIVTGHSLGGNLAAITSLEYSIPETITYNASPITVNSSLVTLFLPAVVILVESGNQFTISKRFAERYVNRLLYKRQATDHEGNMINIVTNNDLLTNVSDSFRGFHPGEVHTLNTNTGHGIDTLLDPKTQEHIKKIFQLFEGKSHQQNSFAIDFDGDGKIDLRLTEDRLAFQNLFVDGENSGGWQSSIEVSEETLLTLSTQLKRVKEEDLGWIKEAVKQCITQNEAVKSRKNKREDTLIDSVIKRLKEELLDQLIVELDESFGKLESHVNLMMNAQDYSEPHRVIAQFTGDRDWFLDGMFLDEWRIRTKITNVQFAAEELERTINNASQLLESYYTADRPSIYRQDASSTAGEALLHVTNQFESAIHQVFDGTGLREGTADGIVHALENVLAVQLDNVYELEKGTDCLRQITQGMGENFSNMDQWLGQQIKNNEMKNFSPVQPLSSSFDHYLKDSAILSDVATLEKALNQQVDERSLELAKTIESQYEKVLEDVKSFSLNLADAVENLNQRVIEVQRLFGQRVQSREKVTLYASELPKMVSHGSLFSFVSFEYREVLNDIRRTFPKLEDRFRDTGITASMFLENIHYLRDFLKQVTKEAVYHSMDLENIVIAQHGIRLMLERMIFELVYVNQQLKNELKGASAETLFSRLEQLVTLNEHFYEKIINCFGE